MQHAFAKATACARTSSLREEETGAVPPLLRGKYVRGGTAARERGPLRQLHPRLGAVRRHLPR